MNLKRVEIDFNEKDVFSQCVKDNSIIEYPTTNFTRIISLNNKNMFFISDEIIKNRKIIKGFKTYKLK